MALYWPAVVMTPSRGRENKGRDEEEFEEWRCTTEQMEVLLLCYREENDVSKLTNRMYNDIIQHWNISGFARAPASPTWTVRLE